ncbi:MAG: DUF1292 domain-containing protein [Lachnospiraceae bacterium]|nr:DUF1292 domain-containing protein [Lachnospiraceae bacterium]
MDKVAFTLDNGEEQDFYVIGKADVEDVSYILVAEEEEGDSDALILKDVSRDKTSEEAVYEMVDDERELQRAIAALHTVLEDVSIEI